MTDLENIYEEMKKLDIIQKRCHQIIESFIKIRK